MNLVTNLVYIFVCFVMLFYVHIIYTHVPVNGWNSKLYKLDKWCSNGRDSGFQSPSLQFLTIILKIKDYLSFLEVLNVLDDPDFPDVLDVS